jgi:hypothetical protein
MTPHTACESPSCIIDTVERVTSVYMQHETILTRRVLSMRQLSKSQINAVRHELT